MLDRKNYIKQIQFYMVENCTSQDEYDSICKVIEQAPYDELRAFYKEMNRAIYGLVLERLADTELVKEIESIQSK